MTTGCLLRKAMLVFLSKNKIKKINTHYIYQC